ncbi:MAG: nitronate monooxygenase [Candidatus Cloacimonetes bacterium]|nr:nitronate monooxygenase [Candidatus Cloacimonadota bacterium]
MKLPELKIGELIAKIPIIQGGMGVGISRSGLASAVANEGGIGVISSVGLGVVQSTTSKKDRAANLNALRYEIREVKKKTNGIVGINIMVALSDYDDLVKIAIEEKADILFLGAGMPLKIPGGIDLDTLRKQTTKIGVIVSSARAASLIFRTWSRKFNHVPDAVVVEGPEAGGHLGFSREQLEDKKQTLENILPAVIEMIKPFEEQFGKKIPIIAGGGIFTGEDIYKIMELGADGVQMGTRFVATHECDASPAFKQQYVDCTKEDIVIIDSPLGLPGRAIANTYLKDVMKGKKIPFSCPWKCLRTCDYKTAPYCIAEALTNACVGLMDHGFAFSGSNAYLIDTIVSVKELIETLIAEFTAAAEKALQLEPELNPTVSHT